MCVIGAILVAYCGSAVVMQSCSGNESDSAKP